MSYAKTLQNKEDSNRLAFRTIKMVFRNTSYLATIRHLNLGIVVVDINQILLPAWTISFNFPIDFTFLRIETKMGILNVINSRRSYAVSTTKDYFYKKMIMAYKCPDNNDPER